MQLDPSLRPGAAQLLSDAWLVHAFDCGTSTTSTASSLANLVGLAPEASSGAETQTMKPQVCGIPKDDIVEALLTYSRLNDERETCWLAVANQLGEWGLGERIFCALDEDHDGIVSPGDLVDFIGKEVGGFDSTTWFSYSEIIAALLLRFAPSDESVRKLVGEAAPFAFDASRAHVEMEYDQFYSIVHNHVVAPRIITYSS
jgi:hypothetical protein